MIVNKFTTVASRIPDTTVAFFEHATIYIHVFLTLALIGDGFMPRPIYPKGNIPQYPLDRRLG
jgi:hypothetical protein